MVFGTVEDGIDVVRAMEKMGTCKGNTTKTVVIADCGQLK